MKGHFQDFKVILDLAYNDYAACMIAQSGAAKL